MKRWVPLAVSALAFFLPVGAADASGDYGCDPVWKLPNDSYGCSDSAMLSPGNDTRTNLFYLLRDKQNASSVGLSYKVDDATFRTYGHTFFTWGELRAAYFPEENWPGDETSYYGSRCNSLELGTPAFEAAMKRNAKLPAAERDALYQARGLLGKRCSKEEVAESSWPAAIKSAPGREFLAYLRAADAFYAEQWDSSRQGFEQLRKARDPWVAEAAAYMIPRVDLNAAQATSFDEYGYFAGPEKADRDALAKARAGFAAYLRQYGQGQYAASARGLIRRTMWLGGDALGLSREYEALLGITPATRASSTYLVDEIDAKLLMDETNRKAIDGPLLLATIDLMMMRQADAEDYEGKPPVITAEAIAAQAPRFTGREDLFAYVTASHAFYVQKDPRKVLQLIPDDAKQPSYTALAFSRQVLRGMALAALRDRNEAGFWRDLLGGAKGLYQRPLVELALALNYERNGKLADVFAAGSPIGDTKIREILLQHVAGPDILRAQVRNTARPQHERDLALFTLLQRDLTNGDYAGFLADRKMMGAQPRDHSEGLWDIQTQENVPLEVFGNGKWSEDYACPELSATAAALARNPRDAKARLCIGEFFRLNGFDYLYVNNAPPGGDELGGTRSLFPGRATPRGVIYSDVIADAGAPPPDKAYALYRAVNCYAPGGNNSCGGKDVAESQRKAWFQQLKTKYPKSEWAQKLKYYW